VRRALAVTPALALSGGVTLVALVLMVAESVGVGDPSGTVPVGLHAYGELLSDPAFPGALAFSLWVAVAGTILAVVGALAVVWTWTARSGRRRFALAVLQVNLAVPHLVWAVALAATLAPSGWVARLLAAVGLVDRPGDLPLLVGDAHGVGIVVHLASKELPFLVLVLLPLAGRRTAPLLRQAATLGAGAGQRLRLVLVPSLAPALVPGAVVAFAYALGAFEPALVLGTQQPRTLAVVVLERFRDPDLVRRADAQALSVVLLVIVLAVAAGLWAAARSWMSAR
jgi:ABC-type uncharacterized transport system YnjBCD permease subunit